MNSTEILDRFRLDVDDAEVPYLWSDEEIYKDIDDAQKMFCRLTGGLPDATSVKATRIAYVAGDEWIATDRSILKIRAAFLLSVGRTVDGLNFVDWEKLGMRRDSTSGTGNKIVGGRAAH